jgi:hypothetical protein
VQPCAIERIDYYFRRAFDKSGGVRVFYAQDKRPAILFCDKIRIKRRSQAADVHIPGRAGRKPRPHPRARDFIFHILKKVLVHAITNLSYPDPQPLGPATSH